MNETQHMGVEAPENQMGSRSAAGENFKVVGYYPCWVPDCLDKVDFGVITHVNYAFVIPTEEGGLLPLRNPQTARELIRRAHSHGAKAMIVVGGWDYLDIPLEQTFVKATDTPEKRKKLADQIMNVCMEFGFDGVDLDWEHPRVGTASAGQYEALMLDLSRRLHSQGLLLTCAVHAGALPQGGILPDAAAQSDAVLEACDWINIMAYDGGEGADHSTYAFAVACAEYWQGTRGLSPRKVVLGVPFYARPSWEAYDRILQRDPEAFGRDVTVCSGVESFYNGIPTIQEKARYAKAHLGGIMIWELSQDSLDPEKSLLAAIGRVVY